MTEPKRPFVLPLQAFIEIAQMLAAYRNALLKEAFTRREAIWLTGLYQQHLLGGAKRAEAPAMPTGQYL